MAEATNWMVFSCTSNISAYLGLVEAETAEDAIVAGIQAYGESVAYVHPELGVPVRTMRA